MVLDPHFLDLGPQIHNPPPSPCFENKSYFSQYFLYFHFHHLFTFFSLFPFKKILGGGGGRNICYSYTGHLLKERNAQWNKSPKKTHNQFFALAYRLTVYLCTDDFKVPLKFRTYKTYQAFCAILYVQLTKQTIMVKIVKESREAAKTTFFSGPTPPPSNLVAINTLRRNFVSW